MKLILDLCGGTGAWSKPYRDAGYLVDVITLPNNDVRLFRFPQTPVYGILAAPPCTVFCVMRNCRGPVRNEELKEGLSVVDACLRIIRMSNPIFWALENPQGKLKRYLGEPSLKFHPYEYGDGYSKLTYIWGKFNPPPKVNKVKFESGYIANISGWRGNEEREKIRSITPPGFARAFFEANK